MAFSTKITFVPRDNGEKSVSFDGVIIGFPCDRQLPEVREELFGKYKHLHFREISDWYFDYVSVLTVSEFEEFVRSQDCFRDKANQELNEFLTLKTNEIIYNWVIIEIYEWESGLH